MRAGFSLVELLVALAVALLLLTGIGRLYIAVGHGYRLQDSQARLLENARYVLQTVAGDLRRTGYLGGITDRERIEDSTPAGRARGGRVARDDGSCSGPDWALQLGYPVFGLDDTRQGYRCLPRGAATGGDTLVVRYTVPWPAGAVTPPAFQPEQFYLHGTVFEGRLFRGAEQATQRLTDDAARVAELVARAYYIHTATGGSRCAGPGTVPALYRTALANGRLIATEVARGVEQLQVRYGIDRDADGSVDAYLDAPGADDTDAWQRVVAVRFWVLLRSECPETGHTDRASYRLGNISVTPADGYRRALQVQTVALRNRVPPP